jgi:hypothetical protein
MKTNFLKVSDQIVNDLGDLHDRKTSIESYAIKFLLILDRIENLMWSVLVYPVSNTCRWKTSENIVSYKLFFSLAMGRIKKEKSKKTIVKYFSQRLNSTFFSIDFFSEVSHRADNGWMPKGFAKDMEEQLKTYPTTVPKQPYGNWEPMKAIVKRLQQNNRNAHPAV